VNGLNGKEERGGENRVTLEKKKKITMVAIKSS
jgi:hypothetical protein